MQMKPSPPSGDSPESYSWATTPTRPWRRPESCGPGDAPAGLGRQDRGSARRSPAEPPTGASQRIGGRQGYHTEHLGKLVAEMQWLARSMPEGGEHHNRHRRPDGDPLR